MVLLTTIIRSKKPPALLLGAFLVMLSLASVVLLIRSSMLLHHHHQQPALNTNLMPLKIVQHSHSVDMENMKRPKKKKRDLFTTKLLAFTDYSYRELSMQWYDRMMALGYTVDNPANDILVELVTVDTASRDFFNQTTRTIEKKRRQHSHYATQVAQLGPPLRHGDYLFALRWEYVLKQLQAGWNVILADVDNIFVRFVPARDLFQPRHIDIFHTYGTKHPTRVFAQQGFVVCGCLTALRASKASMDYVSRLVKACGVKCDDQQVMNELYAHQLQVEWYEYDKANQTTSSSRSWYFDGIPIKGRTGRSKVTNHTVRIWDRDFANRCGFLGTEPCPSAENWASMPNHKDLKQQMQLPERLAIKIKQFEEWDKLCGTDPFGRKHEKDKS